MGEGLDLGKAMPVWLLYPATLLAVLILIYPFYRVRSTIARYTLFALCFRYLAGAHHALTFQPSPIGMSWNALGSSAVFTIGLLLIRLQHLLLKQLIPFYVLVAAVVLSGLANRDIPGIVDVVVKFGYLIIITISIYESLAERGQERTMSLLLWSMTAPVMLQVLSIAFDIKKGSQADGSTSYIGGYNHEAGFSMVLATGFVIACFATGLKVWVRTAILVMFLGGLVLANYRTVIIAFAPLAVVQFNVDIIGRFRPRQRIVIGVVILAVSLAGAVAGAWLMRERFADLITVLSDPGSLMKAPELYTTDERALMSARPYIWAGYIDGYLNGDAKNLLFGFGPDSWMNAFTVYAHNTLVSILYEYGIFGVAAMVGLWSAMFMAALRVDGGQKAKLLAAHISFLLLNMATMPHWLIEGNILYGIICGYTIYLLLAPATAPLARARTAPDSIMTGPQILK